MSSLNVILVYRVYISDIVLNYTKIRKKDNFIRSNNKTIMVKVNEVDGDIWLSAFKSMIDISNIFFWRNYELDNIFIVYKNNDLFT